MRDSSVILIIKSFKNTFDLIISLFLLNDVSDIEKKFKKLIDNCNLMYCQKIMKMLEI